jgi:predicted lipid-binding transport protein (Tim44 family)
MSMQWTIKPMTKTMYSAAAAMIVAGGVLASVAEARPGQGGSAGSRGSKTYTAPPGTQTAPGQATPMQRSTTPQQQRVPGTIQQRPAAAAAAAAPKRGFGSLLMGGLLGAGLFGLLSGAGLFGGLSGFAGILGLLLQVGLIGGAVWLAMRFFRGRQTPAVAGMPGNVASGLQNPMQDNASQRSNLGPIGSASSMAPPLQRASIQTPSAASAVLQPSPDDFNAFEALLGNIQGAYGANDRNALAGMVTPEMMSYFVGELDDNARAGIRNELSGAKLLQGDLSEAWVEGDSDYATVAMRYALVDAKVEIKTGRVVDGSRTETQEVSEVWTFRRPRSASPANWRLSAIQQVQ